MDNKNLLVLVTGQSGSGLGTAIRILKDLGLYCIDNLPFELVIPTLEALEKRTLRPENGIALGIHILSKEQALAFNKMHADLKKKIRVEVIYMMTQDNILQNRFSATRRKHPFEADTGDLITAIEAEKSVLAFVESQASFLIDTTDFSPQDLASQLEEHFFPNSVHRKLFITVTSFGFKYGPCSPADSIYDVRFLKNPFFVSGLKEKTGLSSEVADFVLSHGETKPFLEKLFDLNRWLVPRYYKEGKRYFRIGIECTGGKHRSPVIAEKLATDLMQAFPEIEDVKVYHRDISH